METDLEIGGEVMSKIALNEIANAKDILTIIKVSRQIDQEVKRI